MACLRMVLSPGPYRFVGIRDMASKLYCFLKASQSSIPDILESHRIDSFFLIDHLIVLLLV